MYKVICVGVNQGTAGSVLAYAEKDAQDVATLFSGGLGPPIAEVKTIVGANATAQALEIELMMISFANVKPRYLVLYFSGHGGSAGIMTSTGILPYETLVRLIRDTGVPFVTVILDVCFAASYLGFLKEAQVGGFGAAPDLRLQWLLALASATPGSRLVFSTGPNSLSRESPKLQNGVFTSFFLQSLRRCRGDIKIGDYSWISDQRAFAATKRALTNTRMAHKFLWSGASPATFRLLLVKLMKHWATQIFPKLPLSLAL